MESKTESKNNSKTDKYIFEKLTPISDSELGIYEDALNFVFENDDIRNVAISGSYGAGKSSILESYKKIHQNHKYIHISLAHFTENGDNCQNNSNEKNQPHIETILEGKILNQLIHQIPSDRIPQTNFKVKNTINRWQNFLTSLLLLIGIVASLIVVFFNNWCVFFEKIDEKSFINILSITTDPEARFFIGCIVLILIFLFFYKIIQYQKNKHIFRKFNIQGNEIEIFEKSDESYFDKYLNEVLYLFENIDADVIVFEDMDRFEVTQIFARLREINTLINLNQHKDKIIRFFYLLKDDIFASKDRTKFFDYIIPIVPVVDGSNSFNQFISHFEKNRINEKFDKGFLQGLSLYVDDMRLLKNICNEFIIYYNKINTTELDCNKMLAIVTYKNLFPNDFSDLQLNKGFVNALFKNKDTFVKAEHKKLIELISNKKSEIERVNKESLESVDELNIIRDKKIQSLQHNYSYNRQEFERWEKNEYPKRKSLIEIKTKSEKQNLEQELEILSNKLQHLESMSLKDIINRENIDEIFSYKSSNEVGEVEDYNEIKRNEYFPLLKYLIRNGYIDETHTDYMTYFYENSLSKIDKIFLRSITDRKAKEYIYELKDPQIVYDRLKISDFDQQETLNNSLLDYMLQNNYESEQLKHLIDQLKNSKAYKFIEQYFDEGKDVPDFIKILGNRWPELFSEILLNNKMSSEHIRKLSINTLYY